MTELLQLVMAELASENDCFVGTGPNHIHIREQVLTLGAHYHIVSAGTRLRTGDEIWFADVHERIVQHQITGNIMLLQTANTFRSQLNQCSTVST